MENPVSSPTDPYKVLQTILEMVRERSEKARYSKDQNDSIRAILENQERLAEAFLIVGALLSAIVDNQLTVTIAAPDKDKRS